MSIQRSLTLPLLLLTACGKVVEAPTAFNDLAAFIFQHQPDEDQAELQAGLEELAAWLETDWVDDEQGYEVAILSQDAMDALDEQDRPIDRMVGLSLVTLSHHPVESSTYALVAVDQDLIFPDTFAEYERTYLSGPDCFIHRSCSWMEAIEDLMSTFALGLTSTSQAHNQYTWVETSRGWAMVHRNWQVEPPEVNFSWMEVDQQAYLNLFIPTTGGAYRMQAQWTVYAEDNNVDEDLAKGLIINYFKGSHEEMEAWLDENDVPL